MNKKLSRRTILQVAIGAGVDATAPTHAAGAEQPQSLPTPGHGRPPWIDPYEDMLRLHGGELGGRKLPR